jgi:hypothetical protein
MGCREKYLELKLRKEPENLENYIMRSFIIYTLEQILLRRSTKER